LGVGLSAAYCLLRYLCLDDVEVFGWGLVACFVFLGGGGGGGVVFYCVSFNVMLLSLFIYFLFWLTGTLLVG